MGKVLYSFAATKRYSGPLALCSVLACVAQSQAQTMTSLNSTATVNPTAQAGMNSWTINGQQEMSQQWFWYSLGPVGGSTPPQSIDSLNLIGDSLASANQLNLTYLNAAAGFTLTIGYTLTGTAPGNWLSDMGEIYTIYNTSSSPLVMEFYKYSDFDLQAGQGGNNSVTIYKGGPFNLYNDAYQTSQNMTATSDIVTTPGSQEAEAALEFSTLTKLNDGLAPMVLNDNASAGPGAVTSAFEWDLTIPAGQSAQISTDDRVQSVPEPSVVQLISAGGLALFAWGKRRRQS